MYDQHPLAQKALTGNNNKGTLLMGFVYISGIRAAAAEPKI
jgi:hypothetical protein